MKREIITADAVRTAHRQKLRTLSFAPGSVVTPAAVDLAKELGVVLERGAERVQTAPTAGADVTAAPSHAGDTSGQDDLLRAIRARVLEKLPPELRNLPELDAVIQRELGANCACGCARFSPDKPAADPNQAVQTPPRRAKSYHYAAESFAPSAARGITLFDALEPEQAGMAAGYMEWERDAFDWQAQTCELHAVLKGELQVTVEGDAFTAKQGDVLCLPAGVKAHFAATGRVRLVCLSGRS